LQELIGLGAKTLVVPGNLPIGCIPAYLLAFQSDEKEDYEPGTGCIKWLNEFARYHNKLLIEELEKLRKLHPRVTIIYADYYGAAMEVFVSPQQYGEFKYISFPFFDKKHSTKTHHVWPQKSFLTVSTDVSKMFHLTTFHSRK
jgi:hypothetical protein